MCYSVNQLMAQISLNDQIVSNSTIHLILTRFSGTLCHSTIFCNVRSRDHGTVTPLFVFLLRMSPLKSIKSSSV